MRVYVVEDYKKLSRKSAQIVAGQIQLKPKSVLGLATGSTPLGMYEELVKMYKEGDLDFSEVTTFNLDEYYELDKDNPESYYTYMNENLFKHVNINKDNVNIPDGMAENVDEECKRYEDKIESAGRIDLQVLGIGRNGHIGFNEPNLKFEALTHLVELDEETIKDNSRFFDSVEEVPTKAISMGIKTIMQSKKIVLLANGKDKAQAIKKALTGEIKPEVPASILQLHPDITVIVDKDAAELIDIDKV